MEFLRRREPHHPKFACALFLGRRCRKAALHKRHCWLSRRRVEFIDVYIGLGELRLEVDATTAVAISFGLRSNDVLLGFNTQRALELKRRFGISYLALARIRQAGDLVSPAARADRGSARVAGAGSIRGLMRRGAQQLMAYAARISTLPIDALMLSDFSRADAKRVTLATFLTNLLSIFSGNSFIIP